MSQQRRTTYLTSVAVIFLSLLVGVFLFGRKRFSKSTPLAEVTKHTVETSPEEALAYWTADKKRDAKPAPMPVVDEPQQGKHSSHTSRPNQN